MTDEIKARSKRNKPFVKVHVKRNKMARVVPVKFGEPVKAKCHLPPSR
jgi:hypothetical protein